MCGTVPTPITRPRATTHPWSRVPERKVTLEDIKYVLSSHYQGTEYDCYGSKGYARHARRLSSHRHQPQQSARRAAAAPLCAAGVSRRAVDGVWLQLV
ncbi:MAG: C69 family dipeptidase [Collinsella sp.]